MIVLVSASFAVLLLTRTATAQQTTTTTTTTTRLDRNADLLQGATPWTRATDFPIPHDEPEVCRTSLSLRACDPDTVFADHDWWDIDSLLSQTNPTLSHPCGKVEETDHGASPVAVQIAVAVTRKLDLTSYRSYEDPHGRAAEVFARGVHDNWGVGVDRPCGGTGILLFLSDLDRTVYISRGNALQGILTDRRIDRVIENMKPFLQRQQYKNAVIHAINEMVYLIHTGPPDFYERLTDFLTRYSGLLWIGAMFAFFFYNARRQRAQQRQYAAAAAHLDELERARAQALQGHFKMESCPICLESFPKKEGEANPTMGSDGQPIKLLRCGHCFDESCWAEWVNTGRGQIDKCPVCQQSVARAASCDEPTTQTRSNNETTTARTTSQNNSQDPRREARSPADTGDPETTTDTDPLLTNTNDPTLSQQQQQQQPNDPLRRRALQRYQYERNFRLARLAARYPRFITQQHVQRWTSSTYNGEMVRDPSFVQNDPSRHAAHQQQSTKNSRTSRSSRGGGSNGSSRVSTFGGGKSGGGRSGRW